MYEGLAWICLVQYSIQWPVILNTHGNESSVSIKGGTFLDQLSEYQRLRKDCSTELS
jgi:hypothetical protein